LEEFGINQPIPPSVFEPTIFVGSKRLKQNVAKRERVAITLILTNEGYCVKAWDTGFNLSNYRRALRRLVSRIMGWWFLAFKSALLTDWRPVACTGRYSHVLDRLFCPRLSVLSTGRWQKKEIAISVEKALL